jgi:hypothetical protein
MATGHPHGERQQLHHLMPPDPATRAAGGFRKRLQTMPAVLRRHCHDLVHLLNRQQGSEGSTVTGLATPLAVRRGRFSPLVPQAPA